MKTVQWPECVILVPSNDEEEELLKKVAACEESENGTIKKKLVRAIDFNDEHGFLSVSKFF